MPTDFPNGVSSPNAPNYASPLLDFSPISDVPNSYYKGQSDQLQLKAKTAFRNGIPKTPAGQPDWTAATNKLIELGDYGSASAIGTLGIQQRGLDMLGTNPEANPGAAPAAPAPAAPSRKPVAFDDRPARPNNSDGFDPPGNTSAPTARAPGAQVAQGGNTASDAPQPGVNLPPPVKAEIDRRATNGSMDVREANLSKLMMYGPTKAIQDYAKLRLEALQKERESTPAEKELRSGTTQAGENIKVEGANRTLTTEEKNLRGGSAPGGISAAQAVEDIKVGGANRTRTPEQKNVEARPGESAAEAAERIKTRGTLASEAGKKSIDNFEKDYRGLQVASQSAYNGIAKAKLGSQLTQAPGFYSGPLQPTTQMYQQFKSVFGNDPSSAVPQEAFQKVVTDMLTEQIKALGQSGVGRVLMVEVQNMQKSIASLGITPAANRVLLETVQRVYGQSQQLAEIARSVAGDKNIQPQDKQVALDTAADRFHKQNPIFRPEEVADPRLIGAPTVPAGVKTIPAFNAWVKTQNLPSGYPVRLPDGGLKMVP